MIMALSQGSLQPTESVGHFFDTLIALVSREFRMRYKGSFFGILWAVLSPLGTVATLQLVFTQILTLGVPNFAVFLYSALLPWVWFQASVQTSASTLSDNRDLVRTPFFPKSLLPGVVTCTNFLLYLCALPVLFALMAVDDLPLTRALVTLPAIWLVQGILTLGFTVLISAIGILVRDITHLMGLVMTLWFYLTPIFYDLKQVPPYLATWLALNPMAVIVSAHRDAVLYGRNPDWTELGVWAMIGLGLLAASIAMFRRLEDTFVDAA
jgi:ABC-type polysaccharide/polyol phosphate export permease